jgi:gliding motility-associated-like protein
MNKIYIILIIGLLFVTSSLFAQNLVPNWSFEDTIQCPVLPGQINFSTNWDSPSAGTPDYFKQCSPLSGGFSVPLNSYGYQLARTGNAYSGIHVLGSGVQDFREYLQIKLSDSLIKDKKYCINFYVNLSNIANTAISGLGIYFSNNPISEPTFFPIGVIPQIINLPNAFLNDTALWMPIYGEYIALGGENYITIGNFSDDLNTDTIYWGQPFAPFTYYYIDDVSVIKCDTTNPFDETNIANVFTPNNDGINEQWVLNNLPEKTQVQIYNRWGVLVAGIAPPFTIQGTYKWDGRTTSGVPCVEGTYFYLISTPEKTYKGFVQLVR